MELIKEILKVVDIVTVTYLIFYIVTGLCVLKDKKEIKKALKEHKFGIIIPARNEERVIGNLLKSLKLQEYPKELYDIFVVANNCTDRTKNISLENGAQVIESNENIKSKGDALRIAFSELNSLDYDAYIIFDADNIVHPNFIAHMNNAFESGYELAQSFRDSKNISDTWVSSCYSIHYLIHNVFLNKARMNLGESSFINGTGVMVSKSYLKKRGYDAKTLTEDIELTAKSAINSDKIAFVEGAITYDEQPTTFEESWKQRKRWSIGTIQCLRLYIGRITKRIFKKDNFTAIDILIFLLSPILQCLGVASFILHFGIGLLEGMYMNYVGKLITMAIGYLISIILSISAIKLKKKRIFPYLKGIFTMPIFVISWIPINILAFFNQSKKQRWEKIEHTKDVTIDKLLEINYK